MSNPTIEYYNRNAISFAESTGVVDVAHLYKGFLELIPRGGRILDAGCGGGRDSKRFLELGYEVEAFDASIELCRLASKMTGIKVNCCTFQSYSSDLEAFDGIWACASLLHLQPDDLPEVLDRFSTFLKRNGVFYVSFKTLVDKEKADERYFCPMTQVNLELLINGCPTLNIDRWWKTNDSRPDRRDCWVNALLVRT